MKKYTEEELSYTDFTFFFKKGNEIMQIASNGETLDKFLTLDSDNQDKLYEYFYNLLEITDFSISKESPDYPDNRSFTIWAKKGIFSYDFDEKEILVAIPKKPLSLQNLPSEIVELLTEF